MKFNLDTDNYEDIELVFSESDYENELVEVVQDFCYGMASFFINFVKKTNCDTEKAKKLKEVCMSCINRNIDAILEQGVLEIDEKVEIDEDELDELEDCLKKEGFSEAEIENLVRLVKDCGSLEVANTFLRSIGEEIGGVYKKSNDDFP